jgi:geranylgeranyl pyrophosphate synthase
METAKARCSVTLKEVETAIRDILFGSDQLVLDYVREVAQGVGKRLRPQLLIMFSDLLGSPDARTVTNTAACCELLHTASLIHDDVIDEAETRRGLATLSSHYGNEIAVITGDYILALAFQRLTRIRDFTVLELTMAASKQLGLGVIEEVRHRNRLDLPEEHYFEIIRYKTGALFALVCEGGAYLGGADEDAMALAREFGTSFGLGFQVVDDLLDVTLTEDEAGKPTFKDLQEGRITLPIIHAASLDQEKTAQLVQAIQREHSDETVGRVREWLTESGALAYAADRADGLFAQAKNELEKLLPACGRPQFAAGIIDAIALVTDSVPAWVRGKRG